jgi:NTP pyrophosphatase (non-canonical NTP hydrolase)
MSMNSTLEQMNHSVREFCAERDWDQFHNAKNLAIGLVTEASELLEPFRYRNETEVEAFMEQPESRVRIEEEMSDILFLLLRLADRYKIDISKAFANKMNINAQKYPVERARGSNKKYTEY